MGSFISGRKDVSILRCPSDLSATSMVKVKNRVARLMNQNQKCLVLDMSRAKYVNLAALGILVDKLQKIRAVHGDIRVVNPQPQVSEMFERAGVNRLIGAFRSVKEAIRSYQVAS